ncbi:HEPN domain-containing protein [Rubrivirga sp.]|uniref:HEPN domain-containing protein n=1 Tax=Rubrivirga sp. TaxID=1885344 RepID=UPI003B526AF8
MPGDPGDPAAWLAYARSDLLLAETEPPSGVYLELLCFHAQQAAEKAVKAVILHRTRSEPAFSHSIRRLARDAKRAGASGFPLSAEASEALTQYAVLTRYPADLGEVDAAEWQRAIDDARAVVEWAEARLTADG